MKFTVYKRAGQWYWELKAKNHRAFASNDPQHPVNQKRDDGPGYKRSRGALNAVNLLKDFSVRTAPVVIKR